MQRYFVLDDLHTKRLVIRKVTKKDILDLHEYSTDPIVAKNVLWKAHSSLLETTRLVKYLIKMYKIDELPTFVIEYKDEKKVIGTIGLNSISFQHNFAEVGYSLNRNYWNKGIMTEALEAFIKYCFEQLNLNRLEAVHECRNPASGRVLEKVGMHKEGCLRQKFNNKGEYVDVFLYAILRSDVLN